MKENVVARGQPMPIRLRPLQEQDWPSVLQAADASAPWQTSGNREWLENRKHFDAGRFERRHYVAEKANDGEIVAYGSIEGGPGPGRFRVFVVMEAQLLETVG